MKTIAIVYPDGRYLERLTLAMHKCLPEGYAAAGFSSEQEFSAWDEHVRVKALLLYEETGGGDSSGNRERLLSEMSGRKIPVWLLTTEKERGEEPGYLFLYQPVDRLLERLGEIFGSTPKMIREEVSPKECRCKGVISLDGPGSSVCADRKTKRGTGKDAAFVRQSMAGRCSRLEARGERCLRTVVSPEGIRQRVVSP